MPVPDAGERRGTALRRQLKHKIDHCCEAITAGVLVYNRNGCISYANKACREILGREEADLLGLTSLYPGWHSLREDGSSLPREEHPAMVTLATGRPMRGRVLGISSATGSHHWILVDSEPIFDGNAAAPEAVLTTFVDISEWKQAQDALRQREERFRRLLDATSDWVWELDENLALTYSSPGVRDILGYEPEAILGKTPRDFVLPEENERIAEIVADAAKCGKRIKALVNTNVHKSGRLVVLETSIAPFFGAGGELRGYRGIHRDITERKQVEQRLRRRLAMEELVAAISTHFNQLGPEEASSGINYALQATREFAGADRSNVFRVSQDRLTVDKTDESCAEGIEPQITRLQRLPMSGAPWWMEKLERFEKYSSDS
jgi:PAS domain S-box-containing protein